MLYLQDPTQKKNNRKLRHKRLIRKLHPEIEKGKKNTEKTPDKDKNKKPYSQLIYGLVSDLLAFAKDTY